MICCVEICFSEVVNTVNTVDLLLEVEVSMDQKTDLPQTEYCN